MLSFVHRLTFCFELSDKLFISLYEIQSRKIFQHSRKKKQFHLPEFQSAESFARTEICCKTDALKAFTIALPLPADASVFPLRPHSGEKKGVPF